MQREPSDFFHLAPRERVFVAGFRFQSTENALAETIRLYEQQRAFQVAHFLEAIDEGSDAWHAAIRFRFTIAGFAVLQLCRLWDRFDAAGYSIPTLCDLLNDDEVIGALKQELFFVILEGHFAYGPPREAEMKLRVSRLRDALESAAEFEKSVALERLRNFRDRVLAHPIFKTRRERRKLIDAATPEDAGHALREAIATVSAIEGVVRAKPGEQTWEAFRKAVRNQACALVDKLKYDHGS